MVKIAERIIPRKILDKYRSFPVTLRAAFWFTVCNFVLKGISFICMPIYARFLSEDEYGTMSLITSYELIFNIFATFELSIMLTHALYSPVFFSFLSFNNLLTKTLN